MTNERADPVETAFEKMAALQREMTHLQHRMAELQRRVMDVHQRMMVRQDEAEDFHREMMYFNEAMAELHHRMASLQRDMTHLQRGIQEHEDVSSDRLWASPEVLAAAAAAALYAKAFLQTLAKRHADALEDLVETRIRRKGKPEEYRIGVDDGSAATIAITEDTPDEARLALLDLDVTADELRGKVLHWDSSASAWRPDTDE